MEVMYRIVTLLHLKLNENVCQRYEINHEQLIKNVWYALLEASVIYLHPGLQWS